MVRNYFGIGEHDGDDESRRKIAGTLLLLDADGDLRQAPLDGLLQEPSIRVEDLAEIS